MTRPTDIAGAGALSSRPPLRSHRRLLAALLPILAVALLVGCGGSEGETSASRDGSAAAGAGPEHVHGLGVDPADGDLYIATHSGLWRAAASETKSARVGDVEHDLMGFTVVGPDRFLSSGHPGAGQELPAQMGLQRSTDGGRSWRTVSLLGQADLHVLRAAGERVYGVDSGTGGFITSSDGGRQWQERTPPAPVFDLAIGPGDPERLIAATEQGLFVSRDTGATWRPQRADVVGLLVWPHEDALYVVDAEGTVSRSDDGGQSFDRVGSVGSQPEAFAAYENELYAAVADGKVLVSADGGTTWRTRAQP